MTFMYLCRRVCALRDSGRVSPTVQKMVEEKIRKSCYQSSDGTVWLSKEDCEG